MRLTFYVPQQRVKQMVDILFMFTHILSEKLTERDIVTIIKPLRQRYIGSRDKKT